MRLFLFLLIRFLIGLFFFLCEAVSAVEILYIRKILTFFGFQFAP